MKALDKHEVLQELARALHQPCMYIHLPLWLMEERADAVAEILKAVPYLDLRDEYMQLLADGEAWIVFESVEEMEEHYWLTVGDDGPTEKNPYDGPARVYALTCGPDGTLWNENT